MHLFQAKVLGFSSLPSLIYLTDPNYPSTFPALFVSLFDIYPQVTAY